jgi:hypothetical protein
MIVYKNNSFTPHLTSSKTCDWGVIILHDKNTITSEIINLIKEIKMDSNVLIAVIFISVVAVAISVSRRKKNN